MRRKLVIVADDFTGSNDTGVHFRKTGMKVKIIFNIAGTMDELPKSDVLVVDTESRMDSIEEAYRKCYEVGKQLLPVDEVLVYKKLDSTFRGNIGAEIDGLMDAMQLPVLFLAPAWPANGRSTKNGEIYVNGVRLADTEASRDPRAPVVSSRIADLIALQSRRSGIGVSTERYNDKYELIEFVAEKTKQGISIFIFDCLQEEHLAWIAAFIEEFKETPFLIAGSAGLASYLSSTAMLQAQRLVFAFSGSVSERSAAQVNHALAAGDCKLIFLNGELLMNGECDEKAIIASVYEGITKGHRRFIFTASLRRAHVDEVFNAAKKKLMSNNVAAEKLAAAFGALAAKLILKFKPTGALLTGGETAIKTLTALQATGMNIQQEIVPGVQCGELTGSAIATVIATKAGAFGEIDAISKTFEFFKA